MVAVASIWCRRHGNVLFQPDILGYVPHLPGYIHSFRIRAVR